MNFQNERLVCKLANNHGPNHPNYVQIHIHGMLKLLGSFLIQEFKLCSGLQFALNSSKLMCHASDWETTPVKLRSVRSMTISSVSREELNYFCNKKYVSAIACAIIIWL